VYERDCAGHRWQKGNWRPIALKVATFFGCSLDDLFPQSIRRVKKSEIVREFNIDELPEAIVAEVPQLLPSPEDAVEVAEIRGVVQEAVASLEPRERDILSLHFGLAGEPCTLREIATKHGICIERARQIEKQARKKVERYHIVKRLAQERGWR
jgi:DNA-directed RNA polymerase specialized sigma subunit